jgi:hypothetical protein
LRVLLDGALLFVAADRVLGMSVRHAFLGRGTPAAAALIGFAGASYALAAARLSALVTGTLGIGALSGFSLVVWAFVLESRERAAIQHAIGFVRKRSRASAPGGIAS